MPVTKNAVPEFILPFYAGSRGSFQAQANECISQLPVEQGVTKGTGC